MRYPPHRTTGTGQQEYSLLAKPTSIAVTRNTNQIVKINLNNNWYFWINHPHVGSDYELVYSEGNINASSGILGVRPLIYIDPLAIEVIGGLGTSQSPFLLKGNGSLSRATLDQTVNYDGISSWAYRNAVLAHDKGLTIPEIMNNYKKPITRIEFARLTVRCC